MGYPSTTAATNGTAGKGLMNPTAHLIIVGDEVLGGEVADQNGPHCLATLARLGVRTTGVSMIGDELSGIASAVRQGVATADRVLVAGGIGPTHDDRTREAVAEALAVELVPHPEALARLGQVFAGRMTPEEARMAELPRGSELLTVPNSPGFGFRTASVFVFPGVPILLRRLLAANEGFFSGVPWVRRQIASPYREGQIATPLATLAAAWPQVRWGSYPELTPAGWSLTLVLRAPDTTTADRAQAALQAVLDSLKADP